MVKKVIKIKILEDMNFEFYSTLLKIAVENPQINYKIEVTPKIYQFLHNFEGCETIPLNLNLCIESVNLDKGQETHLIALINNHSDLELEKQGLDSLLFKDIYFDRFKKRNNPFSTPPKKIIVGNSKFRTNLRYLHKR